MSGNLIEIKNICLWCKGTLVGTSRDEHGIVSTEDPCTKCKDGYYVVGYIGGDVLNDLIDTVNDIKNKVNDIKEKVDDL